ncbi:MAG: hypothetical protein H0U42_07435, partial [Thermoleophilaceae bacterium]|nr:hypothetical protein [Thermoleophilaceae bacterium]
MGLRTREHASPFELDRAARSRLEDHLARACVAAARRGTSALAAITVPLRADLDLSAAVLEASSRAGERRFCM